MPTLDRNLEPLVLDHGPTLAAGAKPDLWVYPETCNADRIDVAILEESATSVTSEVRAWGNTDDDCLDGARAQLSEPLAGRMIIDAKTDDVVPFEAM